MEVLRQVILSPGSPKVGRTCYLARVLWVHKDIVSCHISVNILILMEELQGIQLGRKKDLREQRDSH